MKNKILLIFSIFIGFCLLSCSNREEAGYKPEFASVIDNKFALSIVNENGNDLLTDKNFVNKISATGDLSKKKQTFSSVSWEEEAKLNFIDVYTDLPDRKTMQPSITSTTKKSYGNSGLALKVDDTSINLHCDFEYSNSATDSPTLLGGTGIYLTKIKLSNGEEIEFEGIDKKKIILVYGNGKISIKK